MGIEHTCKECGARGTIAKGLCSKCYQVQNVAKRLEKAAPRPCQVCGKEFKTLKKTQVVCSTSCANKSEASVKARERLAKEQGTKTFPCKTCGTPVRRNRTQQKRNVGGVFFCSKGCESKHLEKIAEENEAKKQVTPCKVCGSVGVKNKGMCGPCYSKEYLHSDLGKKFEKKCPICGKIFRRFHKQEHCSHACYVQSPQFKAAKERFSKECEEARITKTCMNCGETYTVRPSREKGGHKTYTTDYGKVYRSKPPKFCCRACYREYMASRFERFRGEAITLDTPEGYNEFLSKKRLCCPIHGCEWEGVNLSTHFNLEHNIPAEEAKALLGFNRTTGMVTTEYSKKLTERSTGLGNKNFGEFAGTGENFKGKKMRPEGLENLQRSRALRSKKQ